VSHRDRLLEVATRALRGEIADINVRSDGSAALLNAGKDLMWTGYSPDAELLKGLIVKTNGNRATELVAACLPKFYNHTESETNDASFARALATPGNRLHFFVKEDGSLLRPYVHPDSGRVEFATRGMLQLTSGTNGYFDFCGAAADIARRKYPALLDRDLVRRYTFMCELIHPNNVIITRYGNREDLPVLTIVDLATGEELPRAEVEEMCRRYRLTPVAAYSPRSASFLDAITELRRSWAGTDIEGTVVAVEHPDWPTPFRLKVKGEHYLRLMRFKSRCTLRRAREIAETLPQPSWQNFRAHLLREESSLPEEVLMGYQQHFETWREWDEGNFSRLAAYEAAYERLPARDADQKTFAMSIADHPDKSAFFSLRNSPDRASARARIIESLRRARRPELREELYELVDPALAG